MDRLTILRKPAAEATSVWQYEVLESGETFADLTGDISSAYFHYIYQNQINRWVNSLTFQDNQTETSLNECIPELLPEFTPRQDEIENLLIQAYANVVVNIIMDLVDRNCEGCQNNWPSQRDHECLMLANDTRVYRYLTQALEEVNDDTIMRMFSKLTEILEPCLNGLELLRYDCKDSREDIVSRKREALEALLISKLDRLH